MWDTWLQVWGGTFYFLNKAYFWRIERNRASRGHRSLRVWSWLFYLTGVPAWVAVFAAERNWIAAAVESGGTPAMVMGLVIALGGGGRAPRWLDHLARVAAALGLVLSLREFGGLTSLSQYLELGVTAGFLMGTYLMAKDRKGGYVWLMVGNLACAALMGMQGYQLLMVQQLASFLLMVDAYRLRRAAPAPARAD